jgi:hypothetical protein
MTIDGPRYDYGAGQKATDRSITAQPTKRKTFPTVEPYILAICEANRWSKRQEWITAIANPAVSIADEVYTIERLISLLLDSLKKCATHDQRRWYEDHPDNWQLAVYRHNKNTPPITANFEEG